MSQATRRVDTGDVTITWLNPAVHTVLAWSGDGPGWFRALDATGAPIADPRHLPDTATAVAHHEQHDRPRWILADTAGDYPPLLDRGVRLGRVHDLALTEAILLAAEGNGGQPADVAAAHARLHGEPIPATPAHHPSRQATLFDTDPPVDGPHQLAVRVELFADQQRRIAALGPRIRHLVAAESAGGLVAAEMTHNGLPWNSDRHDAILTQLIGPRPVKGLRPKKLQDLATRIGEAFGHRLNPDSPQQLIAAFHAAGHPVATTRARELRTIDHPAVEPLLRYKELSRIHSAHGWNWAREWISDGPAGPGSPARRFRPRYVVGGVVTGRWATDGGAALQIPRAIRAAVAADPGWALVVADAAQLEPRILAGMSADPAMLAATTGPDMYAALAPTFGGSRDDAKIALLSAMYGGTAGNATALLTVLRRRFPHAHALVETAARTGERGGLVHTWLGRTCPPADERWWNALSGPNGTRTARDRGRFTRNFVVQGTAAEWALAMMALLRNRLYDRNLGHLVFFQHDEIILHCPADRAAEAARLVQAAADDATALLFGGIGLHIPLTAMVVDNYAEAK